VSHRSIKESSDSDYLAGSTWPSRFLMLSLHRPSRGEGLLPGRSLRCPLEEEPSCTRSGINGALEERPALELMPLECITPLEAAIDRHKLRYPQCREQSNKRASQHTQRTAVCRLWAGSGRDFRHRLLAVARAAVA
jgi:hypothetical protein